jgi:hypothetical protein
VSFGVVCGGSCLIILVLGTATVRVTVFVSGLAIFFANVTTLALDASISSKAAHFCVSINRLNLIANNVERFFYVLQCRFVHKVIYQLADWGG